MTPGDPIEIMLGERPDVMSEEVKNELRAKYGLDKPLPVQYLRYLASVARFDFGISIRSNTNISDELFKRFGNTVELAFCGMIIASAMGVACGVLAAIKRNTAADGLIMSFSMLGISVPAFVIGVLLLMFFVSGLSLFPASGRGGSLFTAEGLSHIFLPALTLGLSCSASIARLTRSSMLQILNDEFVQALRAKGLRWYKILFKHTLRNASLPILTIIGLQFGNLLGGAVITETIFSWPGIGKYLVDGILARDYPIIQSSVLIIAIMFVVVNLAVDILYGVLDPRVSYR
jgi:ABC-type dipeptide/oligopeptide/nickel transport system permease component